MVLASKPRGLLAGYIYGANTAADDRVSNERNPMKTQPNPTAPTPETLLRLPAVVARVGIQKSAIYEMMNRNPPAFPRALKISRRAVVWPASTIEKWISERMTAGGQS